MVERLILEVGLKQGQKAAAKFGTKVATSVIAAVTSRKICNAVNSKAYPLEKIKDEEERERVATKRVTKNALITGIVSAVAGLGYEALAYTINESN